MLARIRTAFLLAAGAVTTVAAQLPMAAVTAVGQEYPRYFSGPAMSPNGRFTIATTDSGLIRLDRTTGRWRSIPNTGSVFDVRWSPDGRFIAFSKDVDGGNVIQPWIMPIDPKTGVPNGVARRISLREGSAPAWSPDGKRIAFVAPDSATTSDPFRLNGARVVVVPFNGGSETVVWQTPERIIGRIFWSPDGRSIYVPLCCARPRTVRLNLASGAVDSLRPGTALVGLSKDGRYRAEYLSASTVAVSLASNGTLVGEVSLPSANQPLVEWSPTAPDRMIGTRLIVESNIHAVNVATGAVTEITTGKRRDRNPVYSPDGKRIAYVSTEAGLAGRERVAITNADGSGTRMIDANGTVKLLRWSPNGRYLAQLNNGNGTTAIRLIDVAAAGVRELAVVAPVGGASIAEFVWRADSKAIRFVPGTTPVASAAFLEGAPAPAPRFVNEVTLDGKRVELATLADSGWKPVGGRPAWPTLRFIDDTLIALVFTEQLQLVSATTGRIGRTVTWPAGKRLDPRFDVTADKQWLAVWLAQPKVIAGFPYLISIKTGELRAIPNPLGGEIKQLAVDPAGRFMIIASCPTCLTREHWDMALLPFNGDPPRLLSAKDGTYLDATSYSVSSDGRTVLYDAETYWGTALLEMTLPPLKPRK